MVVTICSVDFESMSLIASILITRYIHVRYSKYKFYTLISKVRNTD